MFLCFTSELGFILYSPLELAIVTELLTSGNKKVGKRQTEELISCQLWGDTKANLRAYTHQNIQSHERQDNGVISDTRKL